MLLLQANLEAIQAEIRAATFAAVSAAEQQSAALKRLIDQSRVDASKTQEMLEQVGTQPNMQVQASIVKGSNSLRASECVAGKLCGPRTCSCA